MMDLSQQYETFLVKVSKLTRSARLCKRSRGDTIDPRHLVLRSHWQEKINTLWSFGHHESVLAWLTPCWKLIINENMIFKNASKASSSRASEKKSEAPLMLVELGPEPPKMVLQRHQSENTHTASHRRKRVQPTHTVCGYDTSRMRSVNSGLASPNNHRSMTTNDKSMGIRRQNSNPSMGIPSKTTSGQRSESVPVLVRRKTFSVDVRPDMVGKETVYRNRLIKHNGVTSSGFILHQHSANCNENVNSGPRSDPVSGFMSPRKCQYKIEDKLIFSPTKHLAGILTRPKVDMLNIRGCIWLVSIQKTVLCLFLDL